jgi:hypothetical protein
MLELPVTRARLIAGLVVLAVIVFLAIEGPAACNAYLSESKAHKIDKGQADATLDSVDAANKMAAQIDANEHQIQTETKGLADAVRQAPAGDSNDAADRAVCGMRAYHDSQRCAAMRAADSARAAEGHAAR